MNRVESACNDPYNLDDQLYRSMDEGHSYSLNENIRQRLSRRRRSTDVYFYGSNKCHEEYQLAASGPLQGRSLCPWYNVMNFDKYRYPKVIAEARCSCRNCRNPFSASLCEKIYAKIKVLRRDESNVLCDANGNYVYGESWLTISIGCACAATRRFI